MSDERGDAALEIARRIADGEPVDWTAVEKDPELAERMKGLKILESIAATHRRVVEGSHPTDRPGATSSIPSSSHGVSESHPELHILPTITEEGKSAPRDGAQAAGSSTELAMSRRGTGPVPVRDDRTDATHLPVQWGQLQIRERIGRGGFGEVYRAYDPTLSKEFALKLLSKEEARDGRDKDRFISEARRHAKVSHPNIVGIHGADVHDGRAGLWMELVRGRTLEQLLEEQGRFGAEEATQIGLEMCGALAAVHAERLVHRDVKTSNIMRREGGGCVLLDFSASAEQPDPQTLQGSAPATGTPLFMAPEIFEGAPAGPAADIYSLGVVLYRLVSRRFPVRADNLSELREKHARGESVPLRDVRPDLPASFVRVVDRALAPAPRDRYASAGELERELLALRGSAPMPGTPQPPPAMWWRRIWKPFSSPVSAAISILALAVVIAAALAVGRREAPEAGLTAEATLFRATLDADERLIPGAQIRTGDQLFLEVQGSASMHVYVLSEDARGSSTVIFPLEFLDARNPLAPDRIHRLPGEVEGEPYYWDVTSTGGTEAILVIASLAPLPELERRLQTAPRAGNGEIAQRDGTQPASPGPAEGVPAEPGLPGTDVAALGQRLRGITTASPGANPRESTATGRPLTDLFSRISKEAAASSGIWTWHVVLENPGP